MSRIRWYGPSIVLLAVIVAAMLLGPRVARHIAWSYTDANVQRVRAELKGNASLAMLSGSFTDVARVVEPSVVHIDIGATHPGPRNGEPIANGSGWVYDDQGHIITNNHVIEHAKDITVRFIDGTEHRARVIDGDPKTDVAVLKIDGAMVHPAELATEPVKQGQIVFAFGSPLRYAFSMSQGIVSSAKPRRLGITGRDGYERFIQTDAAINPGNSGGPLTNVYGQVVGMNTAIASDPTRPGVGGFMGLGFAIPVSMVRDVADQIIDNGKVSRGYLGVYIADLTPQFAQTFGYDGEGVLVEDVIPQGPAEAAGIRPADIIVSVDGQPTPSVQELRYHVGRVQPGEGIRVELIREGQRMTRRVQLSELPDRSTVAVPSNPFRQLRPSDQARPNAVLGRWGVLGVKDFTAADASAVGAEPLDGVLITLVRPGSPAQRAGLLPGRIITRLGGNAVANVEQLDEAVTYINDRYVRLRVMTWDANGRRYVGSFALLERER